MRDFRAFLRQIWRLGDIELPIGRPWFALYWPTFLMRGALWPISWKGWLTIVALLAWIPTSIAFFVHMGWAITNLMYWIMPGVLVWVILVGVKTEQRGCD